MPIHLGASTTYYKSMWRANVGGEVWAKKWTQQLGRLGISHISRGAAERVMQSPEIRGIINLQEKISDQLAPELGKFFAILTEGRKKIIVLKGESLQEVKAEESFICIRPYTKDMAREVYEIIRKTILRDRADARQQLKSAVDGLNRMEDGGQLVKLAPLEISESPERALAKLQETYQGLSGTFDQNNIVFKKALLDAIGLANEYRSYGFLTPEAMGIIPTETFTHTYDYRLARKFWANPWGKSPERVTEVGHFVTDMLAEYFAGSGDFPVYCGRKAAELRKLFSESAPPKDGVPLDQVLRRVSTEIFPNMMQLANPGYAGHMLTYPPVIAIWGDAIASALNPNQIGFEVGPASTMVEKQVIKWLCHLMGYRTKEGTKIIPGGTLTAGGTLANLTALLVARNKALHEFFVNIDRIFRRHEKAHAVRLNFRSTDITKSGIWGAMRLFRQALETPEGKALLASKRGEELRGYLDSDFVVLTSAEHHYSHDKLGGYIGIGAENVISIEVNDKLQMSVPALRKKIEWCKKNNKIVIAILATAGTTETGNIDPLKEIAEVARENNIWFHVDAAFGGALVLSHQYRDRIAGIELADSITFDPHKWLFMPYALGAALFRDGSMLEGYLKQSAPYVMRAGSDDPNLGSVSVQGSMRFSGLKLWLTLQAMGTNLLGRVIDQNIMMTEYLKGKLDGSRDFEVLSYPEIDLLCFRYVPPELQFYMNQAVKAHDLAKIVKINRILNGLNSKIQKALQSNGTSWLSETKMGNSAYSAFKSRVEEEETKKEKAKKEKDNKELNVVALRAVIMNPYTSEEDIDTIIDFLRMTAEAEFLKKREGILRDLV
ncbi:MAG: pyridoxal-dependent decarboxylase [Candidatus Margulisiibacteriota bacterium]